MKTYLKNTCHPEGVFFTTEGSRNSMLEMLRYAQHDIFEMNIQKEANDLASFLLK